jgi:hypothetical protein
MQPRETIMVTVVRILLLGAVLILPGGLLLLPLLAIYQVKHAKKSTLAAAPEVPRLFGVRT